MSARKIDQLELLAVQEGIALNRQPQSMARGKHVENVMPASLQ